MERMPLSILRKHWKISVGISVMILLVVFFVTNQYFATLKTKDGTVFTIYMEAGLCEYACPVYCLVERGGTTIFLPVRIGASGGGLIENWMLSFALIENEREGLVAIIEKTNPYLILAIYDFKNHQVWPEGVGVGEQEALLARLNTLRSGPPFFVLNDSFWSPFSYKRP